MRRICIGIYYTLGIPSGVKAHIFCLHGRKTDGATGDLLAPNFFVCKDTSDTSGGHSLRLF
jgi:hypothetical protein